MKMVKSLLLGSAAGLVAVAGAQAADLPVKAKAVQYVKICSLYGDGFYYVPGTDTCLKLGGYIRAEYGWNVGGGRTPNYGGTGGAQDRTVADYSTRNRANVQIDTRTQSAYGTVRTYTSLHFQNQDQAESFNIARGMIQFAGFTFGRSVSFTDVPEITDVYSIHTVMGESDSAANGVNQIAYTAEFGNGVTLSVGADERRSKPLLNFGAGAALKVGTAPTDSHIGERFPDPYLAFKIQQAWGQWATSLVAHDNGAQYYGTTTTTGHPGDKLGWAVLNGFELKLPWMGAGDKIGGFANYGVGAVGYSGGTLASQPGLFGSGNNLALGYITDGVYANNGGGVELTTAWSVAADIEHYWTPALRTSLYGAYTSIRYNDTAKNYFNTAIAGCAGTAVGVTATSNFAAVAGSNSCDPNWSLWEVGTRTYWQPVAGLLLGIDVYNVNVKTAYAGTATFAASPAGARPAGTYSVGDRNITGVTFRAQRNFGGF